MRTREQFTTSRHSVGQRASTMRINAEKGRPSDSSPTSRRASTNLIILTTVEAKGSFLTKFDSFAAAESYVDSSTPYAAPESLRRSKQNSMRRGVFHYCNPGGVYSIFGSEIARKVCAANCSLQSDLAGKSTFTLFTLRLISLVTRSMFLEIVSLASVHCLLFGSNRPKPPEEQKVRVTQTSRRLSDTMVLTV